MGVRILSDRDGKMAALYCSTSDVAFGPVFYDGDAPEYKDADERAAAFLRWLEITPTWSRYENHGVSGIHHDARQLTDAGLQLAYSDWLAQEDAQYKAEDAADTVRLSAED